MVYGLTIENAALMVEKAKTRKDGVYSFRGVAYRVRNNTITHYATNTGDILARAYGFNVKCGRCDFRTPHTRREALIAIK